MAITSDIRTFLRQDADILTAFGERIGVDELHDAWAYPMVKITNIDTAVHYTQDGQGNSLSLVQIDIYCDDREELDIYSGYIENRLSGHKGKMGAGYYGRVFVSKISSNRLAEIQAFRSILEVEVGRENR